MMTFNDSVPWLGTWPLGETNPAKPKESFFFSRQNSTAITTSRTTWDASAILPATCHHFFTWKYQSSLLVALWACHGVVTNRGIPYATISILSLTFKFTHLVFSFNFNFFSIFFLNLYLFVMKSLLNNKNQSSWIFFLSVQNVSGLKTSYRKFKFALNSRSSC